MSFISFISVRETHEVAKAQQEKNAKLREAFGISEYFVEGTSFDPQRQAKEELAKSEALQKKLAELPAEDGTKKKYALVRTPSPDNTNNSDEEDYVVEKQKSKLKKSKKDKKKKRSRDS